MRVRSCLTDVATQADKELEQKLKLYRERKNRRIGRANDNGVLPCKPAVPKQTARHTTAAGKVVASLHRWVYVFDITCRFCTVEIKGEQRLQTVTVQHTVTLASQKALASPLPAASTVNRHEATPMRKLREETTKLRSMCGLAGTTSQVLAIASAWSVGVDTADMLLCTDGCSSSC